MNTEIFTLETRDFEEMQHALRAWDHQYEQFSSGTFRGRLLHVQIGSLSIFQNRWERAIHYRGTPPKATFGLAVSLEQTGEARWNGQRVAVNDMIVQRPGKEADYISGTLWDSVVLSIPEVLLKQTIADLTHDDPDRVLRSQGDVIRLQPQLAAQIRAIAISFLYDISAVHDESGQPSSLQDASSAVVALIARAFTDGLPSSRSERTAHRRAKLVRQAEDFSATHDAQPLCIGELCRELRVSERTLRAIFHELTGFSMLEYLKVQRLNKVYRELRNAPAETLVKQVAFANGFHHLGHFCCDYKQLFGETPSQTLGR